MAENKTKPTSENPTDFIDEIEDKVKREDAYFLVDTMSEITNSKAVLWGPSIIGFGHYRYKYESGREGDWMQIGFSPRKTSLVIYLMDGFKKYEDLLNKLGKHKRGKSCLYIKRLSDIDKTVLIEMITLSVNFIQEKHG